MTDPRVPKLVIALPVEVQARVAAKRPGSRLAVRLGNGPAELAGPFTVTMDPGTYAVHWYSVNSRGRAAADEITVASRAVISFSAPFATTGPAALRLTKTGLTPITQAELDPRDCCR